jgi:hypothetical protein
MHHQEIQDMEANEDVDIEGGEEPASSLDTAGSGRPPVTIELLEASLSFAPLGY